MTKETIMCSLLINEDVRSTCCGCSAVLEKAGFIKRIFERPINARQHDYVFVLYEIVEPFTLQDCQDKISKRHIGPPWGT